jgi:hypothetical protein
VRYDKTGELGQSYRIGGTENDSVSNLAIDFWGNVHVVGMFRDTADIGPVVTPTSAGEEDVFTLKIGIPAGDINRDGQIGLEEAIHALQVISRMRK